MSLDDVPSCVLLEILNRLTDSSDLARCRVASKALNSVSYEVRSLTLKCTYDRLLRSRSPDLNILTTPFKSIVTKNVLSLSKALESLSISVENPSLNLLEYGDDELDCDDLHLTSVDFVSQWLPNVAQKLRSLSISDFWIQSCSRKSVLLAFISVYCGNSLRNLDLKNAWLLVEGMKPMPMLTSLTLEYIRLYDEDLRKVNECFPSLEVLNLIGVGGLREPTINLPLLRTCQWMVSNTPLSLAINAPNLIELKLKCVEPEALVIKAPLLTVLDLSIEKPSYDFEVDRFLNLKSLRIESPDPPTIMWLLQDGRTVEKLVLEEPEALASFEPREMVDFESLMCTFPNVSSVVMGPWIYFELEKSFQYEDPKLRFGWEKLKKLTVYLVLLKLKVTLSFMSFLFDRCSTLSDVTVLIHFDIADHITGHLMDKCMHNWPRVGWRWGIWREGEEDTWLSN